MLDKEYLEKASWYTSVADAIRNKKGTTDPILRDDFASEISSITGGGSGGECSGNHIIEVDELPTENIDESATYQETKFNKIVANMGGSIVAFDEGFEFHSVSTKPTENIQVSTNDVMHCYYVKDENDIFVYLDLGNGNEWVSLSLLFDGLTFIGVITNESEATTDGYYALFGTSLHQYKDGAWVDYIVPVGSATIEDNGTYPIANKAEVIVNVNKPRAYTVKTVDDLPTDAADGSFAIVLRG